MGGKCPHRKVKKRRLSHKSARRSKFLVKGGDAVYIELMKLAEADSTKLLPVDEDLPGIILKVKQMSGPAPHTQLDADLAAGMEMPDNGPRLMSA